MEGHKGDKEQDIHRKINVFDQEKDCIWCEMDVENKSSWSWSPCSISLLTGMWSLKKLTWVREKNGKGKTF